MMQPTRELPAFYPRPLKNPLSCSSARIFPPNNGSTIHFNPKARMPGNIFNSPLPSAPVSFTHIFRILDSVFHVTVELSFISLSPEPLPQSDYQLSPGSCKCCLIALLQFILPPATRRIFLNANLTVMLPHLRLFGGFPSHLNKSWKALLDLGLTYLWCLFLSHSPHLTRFSSHSYTTLTSVP